jgi:predicted CXXCH cytochrome family protein
MWMDPMGPMAPTIGRWALVECGDLPCDGSSLEGMSRIGGAPLRTGVSDPAAESGEPRRCGSTVGRRDRLEGTIVIRKAGALLFLAVALVALGALGTRQAEAQGAAEWDNDTCLACHADPGPSMELQSGEILDLGIDADRWNDSVHAFWEMKCVLCHSEITSIPHEPPTFSDTREYAARQSEGCTVCHRDEAVVEDSVHTEAREEGNPEAAVCSDCHDPHYATDPPIDHTEIPQTCRTCHAEIYDEYAESVHGAALTVGNPDVPTCTDCHGVHDIEGPTRGTFHLFSPQVCTECHADEELMSEYGIRADVFDTYVADFHGRTITLFQEITPDQDTNAPVCVSCHGVHDIRPADDDMSSVAKENLLVTCQQCHPDANTSFPAAWMSHYKASPDEWPIVFIVRLFYQILIPVVIGGMLIYVAIDLFGRMRRKRGIQHG